MARIFTTFSYKNNLYTAVITRNDGIVTIYVPDESLHDILPAGKATFDPQAGLKIDTSRLNPANAKHCFNAAQQFKMISTIIRSGYES